MTNETESRIPDSALVTVGDIRKWSDLVGADADLVDSIINHAVPPTPSPPLRNSSGERLYHDTKNHKCNIRGMIQREPEWVASRFDWMMDEIERLNVAGAATAPTAPGRAIDQFVAQTEGWAEETKILTAESIASDFMRYADSLRVYPDDDDVPAAKAVNTQAPEAQEGNSK